MMKNFQPTVKSIIMAYPSELSNFWRQNICCLSRGYLMIHRQPERDKGWAISHTSGLKLSFCLSFRQAKDFCLKYADAEMFDPLHLQLDLIKEALKEFGLPDLGSGGHNFSPIDINFVTKQQIKVPSL